MGCEIHILTRSPFAPRGQESLGSIRLHRLWAPRKQGFEALVHSGLGVVYAGLSRPDVLHIHAVGPAVFAPIARLFGLRVVVTHHGPDYEREKWGSLARSVLRAGESLGVRFANRRIAVSRVIADLICSKYGQESDLIPNGVPVTLPSTDTKFVESLGLEPGRYFLQVSRVVPEKRQLDLINAYARAAAPGWKLVLVGGTDAGAYSRAVESAARDHGVVMTGFQRGVALNEVYSNAGLFVLPSTHEGLPIVLLEALSHGCRVLASDIPANVEVGLGQGSYFPVGNVEALADSLSRFATMPDDVEAQEARKRFVAINYNWDEIARRTLEVYRRIVAD